MKLVRIFFIMFFVASSYGIAIAQNTDDEKIYELILKEFEFNILLQKRTILSTLKKFDLKNPAKHWEPDQHVTLTAKWRSFLSDIDIETIKEGGLTNALIAKHPHKPENSRDLNFSPIVYSKDKRMAVCALRVLGKATWNEEVFLYQKTDRKWKMVKAYLIEMN